ncbi:MULTISPECIES: signal recognition particle-docking protein FtsY [unclassified Nitratiruptor]|uniref:signal recognition particle-docking protein FtsY n=1 Tax=unclassified Nitratiruptor TaxID=2624044 RepID=UPI00191515E8|nr:MULTISPECIES: signal recognition particle-docking protein FtsY [unclassified Nitratiruptor]BCD60228.1 fused signal recognition particle receptor [Nitratiruptor sp. YY08-10]BCD64283.1 fused signal recognition particle receptor [Nitratiruptor sp. YY08-14]
MFGFIKKALKKTVENIEEHTPKKKYATPEEIEEILIEADVEYDLVEKIVNSLPNKVNRVALKNELLFLFKPAPVKEANVKPFVELILGVNGAGKTTTIAKLAYRYKQEGKSVILGAADTFRAAAIEQLTKWAHKLDVPIVATKQGHDPSAVAFDTIQKAKSKGIDHVLIDTAGRLHTQSNLAEELKKIVRVCSKAMEGAPHRKLLILDGTQGNSAINQAKAFHEMVGVDGIIVTKLDGTAKGGALLSISHEMALPILYVGTGEKMEDLTPFDPNEYVDTILDAIFV